MPNRKKELSKGRDKRWLIAIVPLSIAIFLTFFLLSRVFLNLTASSTDFAVWALLSVVAASAVCGCGYASLRILFIFSVAGIAVGFSFFGYILGQSVEHAGIVALVTCIQIGAVFFLLGACAQMLMYLSQKRRR